MEHKAEALPVAEGPRKAQATQAVQAVQAAVPETQARPCDSWFAQLAFDISTAGKATAAPGAGAVSVAHL